MSEGIFWTLAVTLGLIAFALLAMLWYMAIDAWRERMSLLSVALFAMALASVGLIAALAIHCFESRGIL